MNSKIQWTDKMNGDLLECKQKALDLAKSRNPPRLDSGRKKGYMAVMKDLRETIGYYELGLSSQNLRDQAQGLEKMQDRKGEVVRNDIGLEGSQLVAERYSNRRTRAGFEQAEVWGPPLPSLQPPSV